MGVGIEAREGKLRSVEFSHVNVVLNNSLVACWLDLGEAVQVDAKGGHL